MDWTLRLTTFIDLREVWKAAKSEDSKLNDEIFGKSAFITQKLFRLEKIFSASTSRFVFRIPTQYRIFISI